MTVPGQLQPTVPTSQELPLPCRVVLALEDGTPMDSLYGGALGAVAIYTGSSKATHITHKVILRMEC